MNGSSSATAIATMFEPLVTTPAQIKHKKKQKKSKHEQKAQLQTAERRVLHHVSEAEGSSKLASKVYERELARLQVELVKMQ